MHNSCADDIALGLTRDRHGNPLLARLAGNASTNENWIARGLSDEGPFVNRFYQALYRSNTKRGRIHFHLDDLDLDQSLRVDRFSDPFDVGVTNWELQQVLHDRGFYESTDFFLGGQKLSPEDVLEFGLHFRGR